MAKRRKSSSCTTSYKRFAKCYLKGEIRKAGSAKAGMKALAKEWRAQKRK